MLELADQLATVLPAALEGTVVRTVGSTVAVAGFPAPIGAHAEIERPNQSPLAAEVIGFCDDVTLLYPFSDPQGVRHGNRARLVRTRDWLRVGPALLGRIIDARGRAIDGGPQPALSYRAPLERRPPGPVERPRIDTPLATGIRVIDGLLTCGRGQRIGVFGGSGAGKSVALGMMSRYTAADVNVIALVGERGREVNEFIERDLGPAGLAKSVVVVATSDESALLRIRAALVATAVAEYFRDLGRDVLLVMDSLSRFAAAQREIGLAAGEPPTTRGFPPSVFARLPRLVERAGRGPRGSITAFYAVLVEADDPQEPISDAVRSLLDGHTWLSRKLAASGHYPAVDVLDSISRLMKDVTGSEHQDAAALVRELLAAYRDQEDLIAIGAYRHGSNPLVDVAIEMRDEIHAFLRQGVEESGTLATAREALLRLAQRCLARRQASRARWAQAAGEAPQPGGTGGR